MSDQNSPVDRERKIAEAYGEAIRTGRPADAGDGVTVSPVENVTGYRISFSFSEADVLELARQELGPDQAFELSLAQAFEPARARLGRALEAGLRLVNGDPDILAEYGIDAEGDS